MGADPIVVRNLLLASLSFIFLWMLYGRYRQRVKLRDMPVPRHAELLLLEVAYHPARLRVLVHVRTANEVVRLRLLDVGHHVLHEWAGPVKGEGEHWLELALDGRGDGAYHLEMSTSTQRTERSFRLQHA